MAIGTGTKLGPYELSDMLGAGGMGEVYRARDPRLKRDVAVKVLPCSFSSDPERLHRFEQEAQAAAALNHPNILAVYDVGTRDGSPYIVSELLTGSTLRELLNTGPIPVRKALNYAVQIAHGLAAAHEKGIVHRDLKPENTFITDDRVKLLDFGLAKLTRPEVGSDGQTLTGVDSQVGTILGTVGYMSPEQVRAKLVDARSDIFSFGAILYEMLSGKRAFQGESPAETMSAIVKEEPPDLTETNAAISPALDRIVRHCLEKNPAARFQSARDVAFDLEMVSGTSQPSASVQPVTAAFRLRRFAPLLWTLAVVPAALAAFFLGRQHTSALPKFQPLTYERGAIPNARFAPDGTSVIYDATWDGKPVRVFTTPAAAALPRAIEFEQAHLFAVSASGELALGLGGRLGNHLDVRGATLGRVPLGGGTPREILDKVAQADWAPDETLAVVRTVNGHDRIEFPLGRVLYETNGWISGLRVSPKGNRIAFLDHPRWPDDRGAVAVVDRAGHKETLSREYESADGLAWSPGGAVWFTAAIGGNYRSLRAVDLAGRERTILQIPGALRLCDIAHDGRVLLAVDNEKVGVKAYAPEQKGERDLSWAGWTLASDISPDHKWLEFDEQSALGGANYIVGMRKLDGSAPVRLGEGNGGSLSPDGKWVASAPLSGPPRIVLLPTGIGTAKEITVPLEKVSYPQLFPDNRHVMFIGAERGHAFGCYVQDIESGRLQAVTPQGALLSAGMPTQRTSCVPSPDGTSVVASNPEGKLTIYPTSGGAARVIPGETVGLEPIRWCPDGVYAYRSDQSPVRIVRIDPSTGRQTVVRELVPGDPAGLIGISPVVLSPDAKAYAYSYRRTLSEVYVVDGLK